MYRTTKRALKKENHDLPEKNYAANDKKSIWNQEQKKKGKGPREDSNPVPQGGKANAYPTLPLTGVTRGYYFTV